MHKGEGLLCSSARATVNVEIGGLFHGIELPEFGGLELVSARRRTEAWPQQFDASRVVTTPGVQARDHLCTGLGAWRLPGSLAPVRAGAAGEVRLPQV